MCNTFTLFEPILFPDDANGKDINEIFSRISIEMDTLCKWFQVKKHYYTKTNFMKLDWNADIYIVRHFF